MAIKNIRELLALFEEEKDEKWEGAIDVIKENDQSRVSLLSRTTEQEDLLDAANAKIADLQKQMGDLTAQHENDLTEMNRVKAANYDLYMMVQNGDPISGGKEPLENEIGEDGEVYHIENLFHKAELNPVTGAMKPNDN